jgi:hypothetical protein
VAVELRGDDVVLATVAWWRGKARVELSTRSRWRRRTVVVGDEAPGKLGRNRGSSSKQRGSLHEDGLGRRRSGAGCPRACRAWPERERTAAAKCDLGARK